MGARHELVEKIGRAAFRCIHGVLGAAWLLQALLSAECVSEGPPGGWGAGLGLHPHLVTVAWETSPAASAQHRAAASR